MLELLLVILGIVSFFVGIGFIFGEGWSWLVFGLFSLLLGNQPPDNPRASFKGNKSLKRKLIGLTLAVVGISVAIYFAGRI